MSNSLAHYFAPKPRKKQAIKTIVTATQRHPQRITDEQWNEAWERRVDTLFSHDSLFVCDHDSNHWEQYFICDKGHKWRRLRTSEENYQDYKDTK